MSGRDRMRRRDLDGSARRCAAAMHAARRPAFSNTKARESKSAAPVATKSRRACCGAICTHSAARAANFIRCARARCAYHCARFTRMGRVGYAARC